MIEVILLKREMLRGKHTRMNVALCSGKTSSRSAGPPSLSLSLRSLPLLLFLAIGWGSRVGDWGEGRG